MEDITTEPELTPEFLECIKNNTIDHYKKIRNNLLLDTDKYLLPDFPITPDNLIIIKDYRQKLRDFTKNNYELPARPEFI
jgi:hypothetical protein